MVIRKTPSVEGVFLLLSGKVYATISYKKVTV